jgi:hypothetical protein
MDGDRTMDTGMKKGHIESVRQDHAAVRVQVMHVLGWDELRYASLQEQKGREWVAYHMGVDSYMADEVVKHRTFWSWWRLHWVRRDREFLDMSGLLFRHELEGYYVDLHTVDSLTFYPHAQVMQQAYSDMMHRLIKRAVR